MTVKNFDFRNNWVGRSEAASMKIIFFAIFGPIWTHILPEQAQILDFLNRILIFNPLERHKLYYYQLWDFRTNLIK